MQSMPRDIYHRDNDTTAGKRECDGKMLAGLYALVPKGIRRLVDRQLVQSIFGLRNRMGHGNNWSS